MKRATRHVLLALEVAFLADALKCGDNHGMTKNGQSGRVGLVRVLRCLRLQSH